MKTFFPEEIRVQFIDKTSSRPVSNLAVMLTLFAKEKNDYSIGPRITDNQGLAIFLKKDVEKEIDTAKKMFIMDYKSSLEECSSMIEIKSMSIEAIESFIKAAKLYGSVMKDLNISEEYEKKLRNGINSSYFPVKSRFELSDLQDQVSKVCVIPLPVQNKNLK